KTSADGFQAFDPFFDLLCGQTVDPSHSRGRQGVVHHMYSRHGDQDGKSVPAQMDPAGNSFQTPVHDLIRINVAVFVQSEKYRPDSLIFHNRTQLTVVAV